MKKQVSCALALIAALSPLALLGGCGSSYSEDAVVVYVEYNGLPGAGDEQVRAAIEEKFFADTGEKIELVLEACSSGSIGQKTTGALGADGDRIDAIVTHYSSDSIITPLIGNERELKNLTELVSEYAPAYLKAIGKEADPEGFVYNKGLYDGKIFALSSLEHTSPYGMLINRNYMANTSFDPDRYDVAKEGYESLTIDEFTQLLKELKANNSDVVRPVVGAPYDLEYFIAPVFDNVGYTHMDIKDGVVYPAYATESYLDVLEYERMLQVEKLWNENPLSNPTADRDFTAGRAAVYTLYPEVTQQINTARDLKKARGDDCIMIAPLKKNAETPSNGNARQQSAFLGLTVPQKGKNTEKLLKYINWLYADKENYELARYGIKGEHWEIAETASGEEAYVYPEGKVAQFEESTPYSGMFCLLPNITVSNRVYAGYSETESKWVREVHSFPSYPKNGYADEGMNLPQVSKSNRTLARQEAALGLEYTTVRMYAWSDAAIPDGNTLAGMHATMMENIKSKYGDYINFINEEYQKIKQSQK